MTARILTRLAYAVLILLGLGFIALALWAWWVERRGRI